MTPEEKATTDAANEELRLLDEQAKLQKIIFQMEEILWREPFEDLRGCCEALFDMLRQIEAVLDCVYGMTVEPHKKDIVWAMGLLPEVENYVYGVMIAIRQLLVDLPKRWEELEAQEK